MSTRTLVQGGDAQRGQQLLSNYGCGGCHNIPGVRAAEGRVAPSLAAFADRAFIAGRLRNEGENLVQWIMDPKAVDPRTAMPDLDVPEADARHMAAYLYTLGGGGIGPAAALPSRLRPGH